MKKIIIFSMIFILILLIGCQNKLIACTEEAKMCPDGSSVGRTGPNCEFAKCPDSTQIANPASTFCIENGGTLEIVNEASGQIGICTLSDGQKCEEWAYFRGECPSTNSADKATRCSDPRPEICTMEYIGVCGFFNESIKCIKYPCAATYATGCTACSDPKVAYWIDGECPK